MSITNEITRLGNAKSAIAAAIESKGVDVPVGTKLDGMAALIGQIEQGGGDVIINCPGGSAPSNHYHGVIVSESSMPEVYYTDQNGIGQYEFGVDGTVPLIAAADSYLTVVNINGPSPICTNCELIWVFYNELTGNNSYMIQVTGDNFRAES